MNFLIASKEDFERNGVMVTTERQVKLLRPSGAIGTDIITHIQLVTDQLPALWADKSGVNLLSQEDLMTLLEYEIIEEVSAPILETPVTPEVPAEPETPVTP